MSRKKPRICLVAHYAYGAMSGGRTGHVGGVERQTTLTARWLANRGYDVSLLTWNEGQPWDSVIDGVRVISICRIDSGISGIRFFHPRMTGLFAALKRANADVYYQNCAEYVTGLVALWCRFNRRKFVFSSAHDFDCNAGHKALKKTYARLLYKYGLFHADRIIVQTEFQRELLKKTFALESVPLPMPCPGPSSEEFRDRSFPRGASVVWVGRAVPQKRVEWLLDIAERLPDINFEIAAANIAESPYVNSVVERAKKLNNVKWLGPVAREHMPDLYRRALCLCSTSIREGFPNTFLEAWSHGTPLITTFDPDSLVQRHNMGRFVRSVDEAAAAIREVAGSPDLWNQMSRNVRAHYESTYMVDTAIARFEEQFLSVWRGQTLAPQDRSTEAICPSAGTSTIG
jgi:glycosyltransferase involved in cell wall biosynthesis